MDFTAEDFCIDVRQDSFALCFVALTDGEASSYAVLTIPVLDDIPQPSAQNLQFVFQDGPTTINGSLISAELRRDNLVLFVREEDDEEDEPPFAISILFSLSSEDFATVQEVLEDLLFSNGPDLKVNL